MALLGIHRLLSLNWPTAGITCGSGSLHVYFHVWALDNKSLDKLTESLESSSGSSMIITPCFFFTVVCQKNSGSPSWFENFETGINTSPCRTPDEPACCFHQCQHCPEPFRRHRGPDPFLLKSCLRSAPDLSPLAHTEKSRDYMHNTQITYFNCGVNFTNPWNAQAKSELEQVFWNRSR